MKEQRYIADFTQPSPGTFVLSLALGDECERKYCSSFFFIHTLISNSRSIAEIKLFLFCFALRSCFSLTYVVYLYEWS